MKTNLLFIDRPYYEREFTESDKDVIADLELESIFRIASKSNYYVKKVFSHVVMDMDTKPETIKYRQEILNDFINNRNQFEELYEYLSDFYKTANQKNAFGVIDTSPSYICSSASVFIKFLLEGASSISVLVKKFKKAESKGLKAYMEDVRNTFDSDTIKNIIVLCDDLNPLNGIKTRAMLDESMNETGYSFQRSDFFDKDGKKRYKKAEKISFTVVTESLVNEINHKTDIILHDIAPWAGKLATDLFDYFSVLMYELTFYKAALNLYDYYKENNLSYSFPVVSNENKLEYNDLFDLALAIKSKKAPVGNDLDSIVQRIMVVTGANQGGKTTFLRSYGQAVLLANSGIQVPAKSLILPYYNSIFVHFDREEDAKMESGKFDDELKRISALVNNLNSGALMLFNEPFQSTNEHEGSLIGFDIIRAFVDSNVNVIVVTHMYELAMLINDKYQKDALFQRADRADDGARSFKLTRNMPLRTSFALDLYNKTIN